MFWLLGIPFFFARLGGFAFVGAARWLLRRVLQRAALLRCGVHAGALLTGALLTGVLLTAGLSETAQAQDCNGNGREDASDLAAGISLDCNANAVPDECDLAPLVFETTGLEIAGDPPSRLTTGHLDADEFADLVSFGVGAGGVGAGGGTVVVRFSQGDQTFTNPQVFQLGSPLFDVALADFDGNGKTDIAAVGSGLLWLARNLGARSFSEFSSYAVASSADGVRAANVVGDERPEWVITGSTATAGSVSVATQGADGSPEVVPLLEVEAEPAPPVVADLDGDGDLDLAILSRAERTVSLYLGDGEGTFVAGEELSFRWSLEAILAGDLDGKVDGDGNPVGDGRVDLVIVAAPPNGRVDLYTNQGDATFARTQTLGRSGDAAVHLEDMEPDGDLDVIVDDLTQAGLVLHVQMAPGVFQENFEPSGPADAVTSGDFDGDGDPDLAYARDGEVRIAWTGATNALALRAVGTGFGINPHGIALGDYDGDGDLDAAVPNGGEGTATVLWNDGGGGYGTQTSFSALWSRLDSMHAGDYDADGDLDLVTAAQHDSSVTLLTNDGTGRFSGTPHDVGAGALWADLADVDGNGFLDILSANPGANSVSVVFNSDGTHFDRRLDSGVGVGPWSVLALDLDGDGDMDLAAANFNSSDVSVLVNGGAENFAPEERYLVSGSVRALTAGDLDGDGDVDLAAANVDSSAASILLNQGDATFAPARDASLVQSPYSMFSADINRDGNLDLVSANETTSTVSVLVGRGDGTFAAATVFPTGKGLRFAAAGDVDGDGDLDIVTADRGSNGLTVLFNGSEAVPGSPDSLGRICTPGDFHDLSTGAADPPAERFVHFLLPAREAPDLLDTVFPNAGRFAQVEDFLRVNLAERFPALDAAKFAALVAKRATREYFAGTVSRLRLDGGVTFGFDVAFDTADSAEAPTLEEVRRVREGLTESFSLQPLGYFPQTAVARELASSWEEPGFPVYLTAETPRPPDPPPMGNPTFLLEIPEGLTLCGTFATAGADRGLQEEFELKSQARFLGGEIELPTANASFPHDLFEEVRFGPHQEIAEPLATGQFTVQRIPGAGATIFRFTYSQDFVLTGGRRLEVVWARPIVLRAEGEKKLDERVVIHEAFFAVEVGTEALQMNVDGVPLVRLGSCSYETLPRFDIEVQLDDGTRLRLEERFLEQGSELATGPALLWQGEVERGTLRQVVRDYWSLVYSAFKHNTEPRYRIVLDPPWVLDGFNGSVHAVEVELADPPADTALGRYLGPDLQTLAQVSGTFTKQPQPLGGGRFQRGDVRQDGRVDVVDALTLLDHLFRRQGLTCQKAADANDDGRLNLLDGLSILRTVFGRGPLPDPFAGCGLDPTADDLSCEDSPTCL